MGVSALARRVGQVLLTAALPSCAASLRHCVQAACVPALLCCLVAVIALSRTDTAKHLLTQLHRDAVLRSRTQQGLPLKPAFWAVRPAEPSPADAAIRAAIRATQDAHSKYMMKYELRKLPFDSGRTSAGALSWLSCNRSNHLNASRRGLLDAHSVGHSTAAQAARTPCESTLHGLALRPNSPIGALRCTARHATLSAALTACRATPWCDGVTQDSGLECVGPAAFEKGLAQLDDVCVEGGQLRQHARSRTRAVRIEPRDFGGAHPYLLHEEQSEVPLPPSDLHWRSRLAIVAWFSCEGNLNHLVGETLHPVWRQLEIFAPAVVRVTGPAPTPTAPPSITPVLTALSRPPGAAAPACDHGTFLAGKQPLNDEVPLGALCLHRAPNADPAGGGCC